MKEASVGSIVALSGIEDIMIGDTICSPLKPEALPFVKISEPTISMTFSVNDSPFAGTEGKFVTSRDVYKRQEFQGVRVLNINELANAIKPVVLPGEEMQVTIIKAGKEPGQGVAYLNDGTMIVVDGGNKFIGETKNVVVTSVLQTAAGRMIFTKMVTAA